MRVEWIDDYTAAVTRGWFRKMRAEVYREYGDWRYKATRAQVGWFLNLRLNRWFHKYRTDQAWQPVGKLPEARVL